MSKPSISPEKWAMLEQELTKYGDIEQALLLLQAQEDRRKKECFVKYFEAYPKQQEALSQFDSTCKIFGLLGGNRSGKTEVGAVIAMAFALGKDYFKGEPAWEVVKSWPIPDKPCNIWVVGLDYPTLRDVIWREKLRFGRNHPGFVPSAELLKPPNDSDYQIFFKNGSIITGKSADSGREKFQGASVDLVWIDEECDEGVFDECYQRTVDCAGKLLLTLTPLSDINSGVERPWVFDLYRDFKNGQKDVKFVQLSVLDNPYVPEEEKEKLKIKWAGHPEEKARLYGDFVQRAGLVYKMWKPSVHMVSRMSIPRDWYRIACIDPAPTGPTACVWSAVNALGDVYVYDTYKKADLPAGEHAKNIITQNMGQPVDLWLIDPKGGSQRNAETHRTPADIYRDAGLPVRYAQVTEDYGLQVSMEYLNAALDTSARHPRTFVFSDLHDFKDEIERYVWAFYGKGEQAGRSKDKPQKGYDDIMNAWQYILCQLRGRKPPKTAFTKSSERPSKMEDLEKLASFNSYT
jgi:phage terminase large subunit-like protein